jgi:hypothetical protein
MSYIYLAVDPSGTLTEGQWNAPPGRCRNSGNRVVLSRVVQATYGPIPPEYLRKPVGWKSLSPRLAGALS